MAGLSASKPCRKELTLNILLCSIQRSDLLAEVAPNRYTHTSSCEVLRKDVLRLREDLQNCAVKLLEGPQVELPRFVALMVAFSDMCCLIIEGSVF